MTYRRTTALITGASSGLGEEFAKQFAARGANVVLVARREGLLETLATRLASKHAIMATPIALDLAQAGAGASLRAALTERGIRVNTLINNAGFGSHGALHATDEKTIAEQIHVNVAALADLTRTFLPEMIEAGNGALVNVASNAAYQPTPWMAVYGASKAFVLSFTESIAYETAGSGLTVFALSPGATRTEFFDRAGNKAVGGFQTSERVVAFTLAKLDRTKTPSSAVSGFSNAVIAKLTGFLPRSIVVKMSGRLLKDA